MPYQSRFKINDLVEIGSVISSKHTGRRGRIKKVILSKHQKQTLDRYVVDFGESEEETFWDIQLMAVSSPEAEK